MQSHGGTIKERCKRRARWIVLSCQCQVVTSPPSTICLAYETNNLHKETTRSSYRKLPHSSSTPRTAMVADIFQEPSFHRLCGTQIGKVLCGFQRHISPPVQAVIGGILIWLVTVRAFRWMRYNAIHRQFQAKYYKEGITPEEAQKIIQVSTLYDMPLLLNYALAFALFKTYGIVSRSNSLEP